MDYLGGRKMEGVGEGSYMVGFCIHIRVCVEDIGGKSMWGRCGENTG
jgi:hypothetical protein